MSESDVIAQTGAQPITVASLTGDFQRLGLHPGMTVLVHSSLSRLGWVCGGPVAVIQALESVLGASGTLVMPTHSGDLSDPARWGNPPVPEAWWQPIRDTMPAYDPTLTPTRGMGIIAETFRKRAGVLRSDHPHTSFAARGPQAAAITAHHALESGMGEGSPLARLYDLDGWVLLLGVGHGNNTSMHLAEYRAVFFSKKRIRQGAPILVNGQQRWVTFDDIDFCDDDFEQIGSAFNATGQALSGTVGIGPALLMRQRAVVDFAVDWMIRYRH
ncbi:MAG: AAC(3) family N-acetyltransferase [Anaerolineae bacterium]|nr:AAC(3) family N-acetyltransferase [Anaerolineae bacterium]